MYDQPDIDYIDYVLISYFKLMYRRENLSVTSTVNRHISSTVVC